jgi:solute carrier family 32 (vesicular inhibitory amino acid transporter)
LEITQSILDTVGYPIILNYVIVSIIAIIPITKMPLNTRPISTTLDILLGLSPVSLPASLAPPMRRGLYRALIRVGTIAVPVAVAIVFPDFDRIIAFLGSGMCIAICVILPICYYFKILGHEIGWMERAFCWFLLVFATICAIVGTVWTYFSPSPDTTLFGLQANGFRFLPNSVLDK